MKRVDSSPRVAQPPATPVLVYDGQCEFCICQVERWREQTGNHIDYLPSDAPGISERFPEIPQSSFHESLQLIDTDGCVYAGAYGAVKVLNISEKNSWLLELYEKSRMCSALMEFGYRFVARNREFLSRISPCARRIKRCHRG